MSQLQVSHAALSDAANAAQSAADGARGHGSSAEVTQASGAIVGAPSVGYLVTLGDSWDDEIATWVKDTDAFGDDLAASGEDYRSVDASAGGLFGGLGGSDGDDGP
jgi:hypothetical protein